MSFEQDPFEQRSQEEFWTGWAKAEIERLRVELAEANAARERAEAKCAAFKDAWMPVTGRYGRIEALMLSENPGQPLLDKLARVEALIEKWRKFYIGAHAYSVMRQCADELSQALKGEPHA